MTSEQSAIWSECVFLFKTSSFVFPEGSPAIASWRIALVLYASACSLITCSTSGGNWSFVVGWVVEGLSSWGVERLMGWWVDGLGGWWVELLRGWDCKIDYFGQGCAWAGCCIFQKLIAQFLGISLWATGNAFYKLLVFPGWSQQCNTFRKVATISHPIIYFFLHGFFVRVLVRQAHQPWVEGLSCWWVEGLMGWVVDGLMGWGVEGLRGWVVDVDA